METDVQELWNNLCQKLKEELSDESFELWIKPVILVSFENKKFTIEVPNKFFIDWFKEKLHKRIEEFLSKATGESVALEYSINQNIETTLKKPEGEIEPIPEPQDESIFSEKQFNPKYTFEAFVVGPSNRFAHATAFSVAKNPGKEYNPLYIYGGVGLGKTHLLHAIGHSIKKESLQKRVLYITSEKFTNEMIDGIREQKMPEFHRKFRSIDVLLVDDVQFFSKGEQVQEVFHHTFNALHDARKQIVLSSDSPPKDLKQLQERLRSRFEWGVIADISPPDLETRIAILRKKAENEKIYVPDDVIVFIATQIKANIRELEGSLIRIVAHASLIGSEISVDKAKEILKDIITREEIQVPITTENIQKVVSRKYHLDVKDLKGKKRTDSIVLPRQIAMYLARNLTDLSTTEIGETFGGRDHTTVLYACDKIKEMITRDPYYNALINELSKEIKSGIPEE